MASGATCLSLSLARLQTLAPDMQRVALSATVADPDDYRAWLAPDGDIDLVRLVEGEAAAEPDSDDPASGRTRAVGGA